ncbi:MULTISPECIES: ThiF family adenylyltransferase [unclassified Arthrobacter]|uniref:ThiF family adenylyltransferase n=1 Tax=unclassified Arthrobacter TaxID=235627 RepID=UPI001D14B7EB|nr:MULTISPECIES: ThiF family adenylyltransferase [unclassified Arthrobacter]MCC3276800.1 ThiF family adenylyltransferase [Arthrobacter sp. zg-Y20]MCC9176173.1 ThiF family adenylyltransferase [Arthrobacter sp. zg-Y750]MDK1316959.1 ThiF family adenylyltransferase [Arthrobacter sp. zg.Y20]WIB05326.1 ThiF family adenylyltransferase [Arthrobacter sp. zg-Y20]
MRINPGVHVLEVSPGARQLGIGAGSLLLRNLQDADVAFLAALRSGVPDGTEQDAAAGVSLSAERAASLLEVLEPLLIPQETTASPVPSLRSERLQPDAQRLAAAYAANGEESVRRRAAATVLVEGLGRTGALLARTLASAGVGTLLLADPAAVAPTDVGASYAMTDIGMNRAAAVKRHVFRIDPTLQVLVHSGIRVRSEPVPVDLAVTVQAAGFGAAGGRPAEPTAAADGIPRLVVSAQEDGWDVGPLVVPGATACLECLDLHRADTDPGWFAAADALARRAGGPAAGTVLDCSGPDGEETAGSVLAAGTAATAALVFLDGINRPALYSAVLQVRASDGYSRLQQLDYHPACGCRLQHRLNRVA